MVAELFSKPYKTDNSANFLESFDTILSFYHVETQILMIFMTADQSSLIKLDLCSIISSPGLKSHRANAITHGSASAPNLRLAKNVEKTFFGHFSDMTWHITLKFVVVFNNIHIYAHIFNTE